MIHTVSRPRLRAVLLRIALLLAMALAALAAGKVAPFAVLADTTTLTGNPVPSLTSVSPDAFPWWSGDTTVTLRGSGFAAGMVLYWRTEVLGEARTSVTIDASDPTLATATIPSSFLGAAGTAEVRVANLASIEDHGSYRLLSYGDTSNVIPVFLTASNTSIEISKVATSTGGPATVAIPGTTVTASGGAGMVAVSQYASDPVPSVNDGGGSYFDVYVSPSSTFTTVSLVVCNGGQAVSWYDWHDAVWIPVSDQTPDSPPGCTTVTIDTNSSPRTKQLTGTPFVAAKPTAGYVKKLIDAYSGDANARNGLKAGVDSIASAPNAQAKAGKLQAFTNDVNAQTGKALTAQQAKALIKYAGML